MFRDLETTTTLTGDLSAANQQFSRQTTERLCQIKFCPICTKSLDDIPDLEIISHVSVCSLEDYSKLDSMLLGGFLTETYTSSRWVTKIINRVTQKASGRMHGGQMQCLDRITGQLVEEKIPMYIRLGIRLLFQFYGSRTIIETKAIKKVLRGLTLKQGSKFNDPKSKKYITTFINYHKINMDEGIPLANI
jgi:phosphatidylserine decarboxylase